MPSVAEIYCYADPEYAGDIDAVVEALKAKGHRILVGEDLEELTLLLQLAKPTLIIYTLSSEDSILDTSFQTLSKEALEKGMPMILIGPDINLDMFTLYTPKESRFDELLITTERLVDVVDNLHRQSVEPPPPSEGYVEEAELKLADILGSGPDAVEIETTLERAAKTKIATSVSRSGVILVREEQVLENDDPRLQGKMEKQHAEAVNSYSPAKPKKIEISPPKYRDEISAPFVVSKPSEDEKHRDLSEAKWVRPVQILAAVGAVAMVGIFLYLSTRTSPTDTEEKETEKVVPEPVGETQPPPSPTIEREIEAPIQHPPEAQDENLDLQEDSAIPFPATFRIGKSLFFFRDEWEEQRFVKMIRGVPEEKTIHIVGHPTKSEVKEGNRSLGWSRAWSVHRYLVRRGISPSRLNASLGKPVTDAIELDQNGKPRRRFVEIIIE